MFVNDLEEKILTCKNQEDLIDIFIDCNIDWGIGLSFMSVETKKDLYTQHPDTVGVLAAKIVLIQGDEHTGDVAQFFSQLYEEESYDQTLFLCGVLAESPSVHDKIEDSLYSYYLEIEIEKALP